MARVLTIGTFDAVHRGHQRLIADASRYGPVTVVTFDPHPRAVLQGVPHLPLLSIEQRQIKLLAAGADRVRVIPFTPELAQLSYEAFLDLLRQEEPFQFLVGGPQHAIGHRREGTCSALRALGEQWGFEFLEMSPQVDTGGIISASRIRGLLAQGELAQVEELLGRPHLFWGPVIQGAGRGTPLGFPTANLATGKILLPPHGVYAAQVYRRVEGEPVGPLSSPLPAVVNLGPAPTVDREEILLEAHLLDWQGDLRGETIGLRLVRYLRPQQRFSGLDALKTQLAQDVRHASQLL